MRKGEGGRTTLGEEWGRERRDMNGWKKKIEKEKKIELLLGRDKFEGNYDDENYGNDTQNDNDNNDTNNQTR